MNLHGLKQLYDSIQTALPYFFPSFVLFLAALLYRMYDAYNHGNMQLAFTQDSFAGYPYTHAATFAGVALLLAGQVAYSRKLKQTTKDKTKNV